MNTPLLEALAAQAHESWAGWIGYMLYQKGVQNEDGSITIPPEWVDRWTRQMDTEYEFLPESERESDRIEARKYLQIVDNFLKS